MPCLLPLSSVRRAAAAGLLLGGLSLGCSDSTPPPPSLSAASQSPLPSAALPAAVQQPRVAVPGALHDFGEMYQGQVKTHTYALLNVGAADLHLEEIRSTCGCAIGKVSTRQIPPGGEALLEVEFDSSEHPGEQRKTIWVTTNDPTQRQVRLDFTAQVRRIYSLEPALIDLGAVSRGELATGTLQLQSRDQQPFGLLRAEAPDPFVSVTFGKQGAGYLITVSGRDWPQIGWYNKYVRLFTDHPIRSELKFPIRVRVVAPLRFEPAYRVQFGEVTVGTQAEAIVRVTNSRSDQPITIESVQIVPLAVAMGTDSPPEAQALSAETRTVRAGEEYEIVLTLSPDLPAQDLRARLEITTTCADVPLRKLTIQAFLRPGKG